MVSSKVAIIGAGSVGAAVSYALLLRHVCADLMLVDIDAARCAGEVADLQDGTFLANTRVRVGTPQEAGQCDIIVITAGAKQREGETRIQLIDRNFHILKAVMDGMKPFNPRAVLVVVANPCDILTYFAQRLSGLPSTQVFGSGTFLDTARLRHKVADVLKVAYTAVHAYVLGEHGDSQFVAWSSAHIGGLSLLSFEEFKSEKYLEELALKTRNKAYDIIKAKGATYFGIASVVSSICESIFLDQKHIRPLSVYSEELKCCLSLPCVLGQAGIERVLPVNLNEKERAQLNDSGKHLRAIIEQYEPKLLKQ